MHIRNGFWEHSENDKVMFYYGRKLFDQSPSLAPTQMKLFHLISDTSALCFASFDTGTRTKAEQVLCEVHTRSSVHKGDHCLSRGLHLTYKR